jgi:hypothetical protein
LRRKLSAMPLVVPAKAATVKKRDSTYSTRSA